ncbi:MAG: hypothetical protein GKS06_09940 [Acidobacteria bacterium]|nr:hypothetical protein [Acidobacteriota bacterium]
MAREQANNGEGAMTGGRTVVLLAVVVCLVAAVGWFRWERPRELAPDIPQPQYSRVTATGQPPRGACTFDLLVDGPPDEVSRDYIEMLRTAGWEHAGAAGLRNSFELERRNLRVTVRPPAVAMPGWSQMRIVATRCGDRD